MKSYLKKILDSKETASSRRLITLIICLHFIVASFAILFLVFYLALVAQKGKTDITLIQTLETILEYDFYIIVSGLGIITSEGLLSILVGRTSAPPPPPPPPPPDQTPQPPYIQ